MVKRQDLRIGNILHFGCRKVKVVGITEDGITSLYLGTLATCFALSKKSKALNPITITNEDVIKYGFKPQGSRYSIKIKKRTWLLLSSEEHHFNVFIEQVTEEIKWIGLGEKSKPIGLVDSIFLKKIQFIHELQNLYKELSHKELIYKKRC